MKKVISVTRENREFLKKAFNVSGPMVTYALTFHPRNGVSDLAKKIRHLAVQRGGYMLVSAPASEVVHDSDKVMRQYFSNGWMWEGDKQTGELLVMNAHGEVVERIAHASLTDIEGVQARLVRACADKVQG